MSNYPSQVVQRNESINQTLNILHENEMSRMRALTTTGTWTQKAEVHFEDSIGGFELAQLTHIDVPVPSFRPEFYRLHVYKKTYGISIPIDGLEKLNQAHDPESGIMTTARDKYARRWDREIVTALVRNNLYGQKSGDPVTVPFSDAHTIQDGGTSLTKEKLLKAKTYLTRICGGQDETIAVMTSAQFSDLIADEVVSSIDYSNEKALYNYSLAMWNGIKIFVVDDEVDYSSDNQGSGALNKAEYTPILPYDRSTKIRTCFVYNRKAIASYDIDPLRSLIRNTDMTQGFSMDSVALQFQATMAAARVREKEVIKINCIEDMPEGV